MRRKRHSLDYRLTYVYSFTYARVLRSRCSWLYYEQRMVPFPISSYSCVGINRFSFWTRRPIDWKRESSVLCDYITRKYDARPLLSRHGRQMLARKKCDFRAGGKHLERALLNSLDIYVRFSVSANSRLIYYSREKR